MLFLEGNFSDADRLILEAGTGARRLTREELQRVIEHVAQAGFDPDAKEVAGGRLADLIWQGRILGGRDIFTSSGGALFAACY